MSSVKDEIISYIESNSSFTFEEDSENLNLSFSTRENGDVGKEEYSLIDYQEGEKIIEKIISIFGSKINSTEIEPCDEWVYIHIEIN
jgi:hypothetical protein